MSISTFACTSLRVIRPSVQQPSCLRSPYGLTTLTPSAAFFADPRNDYNPLASHSHASHLASAAGTPGPRNPAHHDHGEQQQNSQRTASHSSTARPAPKPSPTHAGHARRRNSSTEKITPKPRPSPDRIASDDRQWSHCTAVSIRVPAGRNALPCRLGAPR